MAREREVGTLEQLLGTSLTPALWFDVPLRDSVPALVLAALVYILAGLALGFLISSLSRTQQEAFPTMFLFMMPAVLLGGFLYPVETMPAFFRGLAFSVARFRRTLA